MKKLYKNKYRIDSHRMPNWDYSRNGKYFVTMCVQNMRCLLGEIKDKKMFLSDFGKIVEEQWYRSFDIRKELFYDEFVIMPNHLHAILIINHPNTKKQLIANNLIEEELIVSMKSPNVSFSKKCTPKRHPRSISSFFAGFKSACYSPNDDLIDQHNDEVLARENATIQIPSKKEYQIYKLPLKTDYFYKKYNRNNRIWQTKYHDQIIRNQGEFRRIKDCIIDNTAKRKGDVFYNRK